MQRFTERFFLIVLPLFLIVSLIYAMSKVGNEVNQEVEEGLQGKRSCYATFTCQ